MFPEMSQYDSVVTIVSTILSLFVAWTSICAVNTMGDQTRFIIRIAYVLMGTGAAGMAMYPFWFGSAPTFHAVLVMAAVALVYMDNWRLRRALKKTTPQRTF